MTWEDGLRSEEVAEKYRVETLDMLLRRRTLRWFSHVKKRGKEEERHRGRPKKSWRNNVETDMRLVGASEIDALAGAKCKKQISRQTP